MFQNPFSVTFCRNHVARLIRFNIKRAIAHRRDNLVNLLEPLATLAWTLGFEYHHGLLEKMWKEILKNHAHDSIGCCCSDKVHREIVARFELA
ncbi:hypothetical protein ACUOA8_10220, partial [Escherichia sp. SS-MK2]